MPSSDLHLRPSGSGRPQSPKTIKAHAQARESFVRVVVGGVILGTLSVAYIVALWNKLDGAHDILLVIGSGLGFLLGGRDKSSTDGS